MPNRWTILAIPFVARAAIAFQFQSLVAVSSATREGYT